ncbi:hypothetical protein EMIHUDRAFT_252157 [Emiliania huxleyi CCMP1516]|uniref:Glycosyltransferase subfamily 4-like N-terminal domain-containing protein n=2 Tax=Emiliania huxleyi TaxID=2903 RepID=A0A0D3KN77_EMIH1|nr:hypothetical protein EMIHUDRAFT_252157 [Emiliania huxleyi CCMP1516]EOD37212.1 hypothetical protein EMIHUDRAFT_252157 [Emiliania huxleyi CCMP1516]|eukprot:XP_005789641.1 hypothetical protein EMIHUDRAFT_252157 [Emiliania huxleyi CCMP1516]
MRVLLVSENVPPQVNGIARRVGKYADGLRERGCTVTLCHPGSECCWAFANPWNFSASMMVLRPLAFVELARQRWDVVHVVMPLNLSGVWLLAAFRFLHLFGADAPRLVVSHCNLGAYNESIFPAGLTWITEGLCTAVFCPSCACL